MSLQRHNSNSKVGLLKSEAKVGSKADEKLPTSLPTVFDPSFLNPKAGQKAGVEIWRIEAFKVVKKEPKDSSYDGEFFQGDSYIILNTKVYEHNLKFMLIIPLKNMFSLLGAFSIVFHFFF